MLVKAYIKKHMFHLPMKEKELFDQVQMALKKDINKSTIAKTYPLTKIEDNENILIEKQNTNIFLLNLLLLVLNHNTKEITHQEYYNESLIIRKLEEETRLELSIFPFEVIEKEVENFLNSSSAVKQVTSNNESKRETESFLENVQFSVEWLKGAQKELKGKE